MSIAAYYRVSSKAQNLDTQRRAVEGAARGRGDVVEAVYQEKQSAKTMKRGELQRLREDVRRRRVRRLYVFRYDRLCRSGVRDLLNLLEEFKQGGCEVIAVADSVDLNGDAAEMI